jgi:hypothetical protein
MSIIKGSFQFFKKDVTEFDTGAVPQKSDMALSPEEAWMVSSVNGAVLYGLHDVFIYNFNAI